MPETFTPEAEAAVQPQDVVTEANGIVERGKGERIGNFFADGRYLPRQILDSQTGLFIDIQGTTRSEIIKELQALREADID
jgi:hypothetical protein